MQASERIMVLGSGGREHALAERLLACDSVLEVLVSPGNAGTCGRRTVRGQSKRLHCLEGDPVQVARDFGADLVVVGPEGPLCDGVVDRLAAAGILAFGPSRAAAQLEGSKAFMKRFAERHAIPTARYQVVTELEALPQALARFQTPPVVKADGLCAGKGVVVCDSHEQALGVATEMLSGRAFGAAGKTVVLEQRLLGAEASLHALSDGENVCLLPLAQDHKRIGEGDRGPNTGGMGAYAPANVLSAEALQRLERQMVLPIVRGMKAEGMAYRGTLFMGLMIAPSGEPQLLEINVRFGDPETQVLMPLIEGDLALALQAAARGELDPGMVSCNAEAALCVVLAAAGYPAAPRRGDEIIGLEQAASIEGVSVVHAATAWADAERRRVVTSGGRVLGVTGRAGSLHEARRRAYAACDLIHFDGMQLRRDIGARVLDPNDAE